MSLPTLALLAGGTATRLRPITEKIPKSLVEVAGEPFLAHQLRLFRSQGIRRVVLLVGHLGEQIEAFVGDGSAFGLDVDYSHDGATTRGTGGAVRNALPLLGSSFFTCYGDSYLDVDLAAMHAAFVASGCPALMSVLHNYDQWDSSNVIFDGTMVGRHEKTRKNAPPGVEWIDYGLSIFKPEALDAIEAADPFDLSQLTSLLARQNRLAGIEVKQRFYEIGKPQGLAETEAYLRARRDRAAASHLSRMKP